MRTGTKTVSSKKPRGRPRTFDEAEVLDRARTVFMEKGFSDASLDDLATATGLNRPSLYAAFGDKEGFYLTALRRYGEQSVDGIRSIFARKGTIAERVEQVFRAAINAYCAGTRPLGCMIINTAVTEAPAHPKIGAVAGELLGAIEKAFEDAFVVAVKEGAMPSSPSPAVRARLAGAVIDTLAVRARLGASAATLKSFAATMVPAVCR